MKKLKILHVLNSKSYSGAENVVISMINHTKPQINSVYMSPYGAIYKALQDNGIESFLVEKLDRNSLKKAIKEIKPDIIHAHDFRAGILSASLITNIPIINHLHNNSPWLKTISVHSFLYAVSTLRYERILTVSDSVMNEFVFSDICQKKSKVVGNPIDLQKIKHSVENKNICKKYEIAFLGRLTPQKNPLFFLEVIYELKKSITNIQVKMIGDGELREQIEDKIKEFHLEKNVELLGFQNNPYEYLYQAKILCMPSIWEGFGLAAVEALVLGKPVVAAPVGGLVNIVNESCGKLCNKKEEYVQELFSLINDEKLLEKKAKGAVLRSFEFDNVENYMHVIEEEYKNLVKVKNK